MESYQIKAYAKINLGLDVIGCLENGYHEVNMVMQTIGVCDELELTRIREGIELLSESNEIPLNENNLIYQAVTIMKDEYQIKEGLRIRLKKRIPVAAGMAGGSSDAAAVFKGINRMFDLGCTLEELFHLGVRVGADVPYCILGGTAQAQGIGEKLTALTPAPECHVLVAKPDICVSTKDVYEHLDAAGITRHPDIEGMVEAIEKGSLQGILDRMGNVLEEVTVKKYPVIQRLKERMRDLGALNSLMSGSGPTVFGIFIDEDTLQNAYEKMKAQGDASQIFITTFC